jgi:hypothetical protein
MLLNGQRYEDTRPSRIVATIESADAASSSVNIAGAAELRSAR